MSMEKSYTYKRVCVPGTTMKVVELVLDSKAYGWSLEELHFQYPYLVFSTS